MTLPPTVPPNVPLTVPLTVPPGEPLAGPWRLATIDELVQRLVRMAGPHPGRPAIVAVDGRSAGGKTTLAARLHAAVPASVVVHTDDIAWNHSFFDWAELLADCVLEPLRRGDDVHYRPKAWQVHGRPGAIAVPAGLDLVLVEGVGAGRRELSHLVVAVVWLQSDVVEAERRGIERDLALGGHGDLAGTTTFWREWMAQELPFVARQRPWERAGVIVAGTPPPLEADQVLWAEP